jgi:hypothetical protein
MWEKNFYFKLLRKIFKLHPIGRLKVPPMFLYRNIGCHKKPSQLKKKKKKKPEAPSPAPSLPVN